MFCSRDHCEPCSLDKTSNQLAHPGTPPVSYDKPDLFFKGRDNSGMSLGGF